MESGDGESAAGIGASEAEGIGVTLFAPVSVVTAGEERAEVLVGFSEAELSLLADEVSVVSLVVALLASCGLGEVVIGVAVEIVEEALTLAEVSGVFAVAVVVVEF